MRIFKKGVIIGRCWICLFKFASLSVMPAWILPTVIHPGPANAIWDKIFVNFSRPTGSIFPETGWNVLTTGFGHNKMMVGASEYEKRTNGILIRIKITSVWWYNWSENSTVESVDPSNICHVSVRGVYLVDNSCIWRINFCQLVASSRPNG